MNKNSNDNNDGSNSYNLIIMINATYSLLYFDKVNLALVGKPLLFKNAIVK